MNLKDRGVESFTYLNLIVKWAVSRHLHAPGGITPIWTQWAREKPVSLTRTHRAPVLSGFVFGLTRLLRAL
jgi:hypothetical protein